MILSYTGHINDGNTIHPDLLCCTAGLFPLVKILFFFKSVSFSPFYPHSFDDEGS